MQNFSGLARQGKSAETDSTRSLYATLRRANNRHQRLLLFRCVVLLECLVKAFDQTFIVKGFAQKAERSGVHSVF
jgi:hypothetical protein